MIVNLMRDRLGIVNKEFLMFVHLKLDIKISPYYQKIREERGDFSQRSSNQLEIIEKYNGLDATREAQ